MTGQREAFSEASRQWNELADIATRIKGRAEATRTSRAARNAAPLVITSFASSYAGTLLEQPEKLIASREEVRAAIQRFGGNDFRLEGATEAQLRGFLAATRGAYGEQRVIDGLTTGTLPFPRGTRDIRLLDFTTPGADIAFTGTDGAVSYANVKIASSGRAISEHFLAHPDVEIVYASSDAAAAAKRAGYTVLSGGDSIPHHGPVVIDIGHTSADYDHQVLDIIAPHQMGIGHLGGHLDFADVLDFIPAVAVVYRAHLRLRAGATLAESITGAAVDSLLATAAAKAGSALGGLSSEPTAGIWVSAGLMATVGAVRHQRSRHREQQHRDEDLAERAERVAGSWVH